MNTPLRKKTLPADKDSFPVIARLTARNTLVIPTIVTDVFGGINTFEVSVQEGKVILTPLVATAADEVRKTLAAKGVTEEDVADAVKWARAQG